MGQLFFSVFLNFSFNKGTTLIIGPRTLADLLLVCVAQGLILSPRERNTCDQMQIMKTCSQASIILFTAVVWSCHATGKRVLCIDQTKQQLWRRWQLVLHQYSLVLLKIIWTPGTIDHETLVSNFISDKWKVFCFSLHWMIFSSESYEINALFLSQKCKHQLFSVPSQFIQLKNIALACIVCLCLWNAKHLTNLLNQLDFASRYIWML